LRFLADPLPAVNLAPVSRRRWRVSTRYVRHKPGKGSGDMPITDTQELFLHELAEIYDAEHTFVFGLQAMGQGASSEDLRSAVQDHLEQTRGHIRNLEQVFNQLGQEPYRETNEIAQGAAKELQKGLGEAHQSPELVDCVIVSAAIKVEHFEMASYRALITGAQQMGQQEVVNLLEQNLREEEEAARIAEQSAPDLIRKAMRSEDERQEDKGLIDQVKDKLPGQ
jgi:ferritin-like metal-binding protein YciE